MFLEASYVSRVFATLVTYGRYVFVEMNKKMWKQCRWFVPECIDLQHWIPYQSQTSSPRWMQQTFALWRTKRHSAIHLVFCLMTPCLSIECRLFARPQAPYPNRTVLQFMARGFSYVSFCHWNCCFQYCLCDPQFRDATATNWEDNLLPLFYFILFYFIYDMSFLSSNLYLCKSFLLSFALPSLSLFFFSFFLPSFVIRTHFRFLSVIDPQPFKEQTQYYIHNLIFELFKR